MKVTLLLFLNAEQKPSRECKPVEYGRRMKEWQKTVYIVNQH